jgi:hypothetical protein
LLLLQTFAANAGSKVTAEAQRTIVIFSKIFNELELEDYQKIDFNYFMAQIKARELNLKNILFTINWRNLVTVSEV